MKIERHTRLQRCLWLTLPSTMALMTHCNLASAREGNVFSLSLSETYQYDDNLFRLAPDTDNRSAIGADQRDDFTSATNVALDASKQVGRHTFYGELSRSFVKFQQFKQLNYTAENTRLGWSGLFGAENNWDTYYKRSSTQSDFADLQTALPNVLTTSTLASNLSVRFAKDWMLRPAFSDDRYKNSSAARRNDDGHLQTESLSFGYHPYTGNVVEAQFRHAERNYDTGGGFQQDELGMLGDWFLSAASTIEARVALLQQKAQDVTGNGNFHQVIGYANYRWLPSGASILNFRVFREISTIGLATDQDAVARGSTFQWTWQAWAKTKLDATLDYRKRDFPQSGFRDITRSAALVASYSPTPSLSLQATAKKEIRSATPEFRSYRDHNYSVALQYAF